MIISFAHHSFGGLGSDRSVAADTLFGTEQPSRKVWFDLELADDYLLRQAKVQDDWKQIYQFWIARKIFNWLWGNELVYLESS